MIIIINIDNLNFMTNIFIHFNWKDWLCNEIVRIIMQQTEVHIMKNVLEILWTINSGKDLEKLEHKQYNIQ